MNEIFDLLREDESLALVHMAGQRNLRASGVSEIWQEATVMISVEGCDDAEIKQRAIHVLAKLREVTNQEPPC